jgi:WD40 repeat protein
MAAAAPGTIKPANIYAPAPQTRRGSPMMIGYDLKSGNIVYPCGNAIIIRNAANPLLADIYYEHTCQTTVAKYAPSGFYIASGDVQGNVRIWDTTQKEHPLKIELKVLSGTVNDISWSADSQRICAVGDGREKYGSVFMWDAGSSVGEISGHTKTLISTDIKSSRPYRLVTGGEDNQVCYFEGPPFKYKRAHHDHSRMVTCVRFSPNGERFGTVATDKKLCMYDGKTGDKQAEVEAHKAGIYALAWSPDNTQILTASADKSAAIWNASGAAPVKKCEFALGNTTEAQQLGCLWFGETLISVSLEGDLTYLPSGGGAPLRVVKGHNKAITGMTADPSGQYLYTSSYDARIIRWEVRTGVNAAFNGTGHSNQVEQLVIQGKNLVSCAMDNTVRLTSLDTLTYGASVGVSSPGTGVAAAKKSDLVVVSTLASVCLLRGGKLVSTLEVKYNPTCVALSVSETEVAVGGKQDNAIHIYTIAGDSLAEKTVIKEGIRGGLTCLTYSPNGKFLASADLSRNILIWAADSFKLLIEGWIFHTATVNSIDWNPDGVHLASGGLDGCLYVWSTANPGNRAFFKGAHPGGCNVVVWAGPTLLASAGQDCSLKTWDVVLP